jgi:hypothetical protein
MYSSSSCSRGVARTSGRWSMVSALRRSLSDNAILAFRIKSYLRYQCADSHVRRCALHARERRKKIGARLDDDGGIHATNTPWHL